MKEKLTQMYMPVQIENILFEIPQGAHYRQLKHDTGFHGYQVFFAWQEREYSLEIAIYPGDYDLEHTINTKFEANNSLFPSVLNIKPTPLVEKNGIYCRYLFADGPDDLLLVTLYGIEEADSKIIITSAVHPEKFPAIEPVLDTFIETFTISG
jgi:hypothetical protein